MTIATPSKVLITPMPATKGIADPDDPRIQERSKVLSRMAAGELSVKQAAVEMGVSYNWARQLLGDYRVGRGDPAVLRKQMLDRLSTAEGRQTYAKRKVTTEPVFGNIKANLRCRRFSGRDAGGTERVAPYLLGPQPLEGAKPPSRLRVRGTSGRVR